MKCSLFDHLFGDTFCLLSLGFSLHKTLKGAFERPVPVGSAFYLVYPMPFPAEHEVLTSTAGWCPSSSRRTVAPGHCEPRVPTISFRSVAGLALFGDRAFLLSFTRTELEDANGLPRAHGGPGAEARLASPSPPPGHRGKPTCSC